MNDTDYSLTWLKTVCKTVKALSRTANGETATAYNGDKPELLIQNPTELTERAEWNLAEAAMHVFMFGEAIRADPVHILSFMNAVAQKVSAKIFPQQASPWRTWDTRKKYPQQVPPSQIEKDMMRLSTCLANKFRDFKQHDPVEMAALLERELDWGIHPWADGCGRSAKILGAWILFKARLLPATFTDREEYYRSMNSTVANWVAYYRRHVQSKVSA